MRGWCIFLSLLLPVLAYSQSEYSLQISDRLHLGGEAGAGFFDTEEEGEYPNQEFRVDEAKLFLEGLIVNEIYVFAEIDIITREYGEDAFHLGELYIDFENVSKLWGQERVLNARVGRFDIPFGEEYLTRDAIDNPLISHSLMDIWGIDEGIQLYGSIKKFDYALAVQNGGEALGKDYDPDKSITGRVLYRVLPRLHFSASAMRTGDLNADRDRFSEIWFGNGFFRLLGSHATSTTFQGDLLQIDGHGGWQRGHLHFSAGTLGYEDDDIASDNSRDANYFQIELVQTLAGTEDRVWYAASRFSRITADQGFPLVGNAEFGAFFFDDARLARELWRLSIGGGYRIGKHFLAKAEYCFENGEQIDGTDRSRENLFAIEVAVGF